VNFQSKHTYSDIPTRTVKMGVSELVETHHEPTHSDTPPCKGGVEGGYGEGQIAKIRVGHPSRGVS
jgi:hypothetical protein